MSPIMYELLSAAFYSFWCGMYFSYIVYTHKDLYALVTLDTFLHFSKDLFTF